MDIYEKVLNEFVKHIGGKLELLDKDATGKPLKQPRLLMLAPTESGLKIKAAEMRDTKEELFKEMTISMLGFGLKFMSNLDNFK